MNKYYNQSFRIKTEKAIQSVNNYEAMQLDFKLRLAHIREEVIKKHNYKSLNEGQWKRIQLLTATSELYQLPFDEKKGNGVDEDDELILKIIIKNFTGKYIHLSLSTRPDIVKLQLCEFKIDGEKIIKIRNPSIHHNKTYLTMHSPVDLVVFKIKYEFLYKSQENNRSRLKSSSLQLIKIRRGDLSEERDEDSIEKEQSPMSLKKLRAVSPRPKSIILNRSILQSARVQAFEKQKERFTLAREKKVNMQLYRQKSKSLKQLSYHCSTILSEYKSHIGQITEKKRELVKKLSIFIKTVSWIHFIHDQTSKRELGLRKAYKSSKMVKKCAKKFMNLLRELKTIQPNRARRELLAVFHHSAQIAKIFNWEDKQKAKAVIQQCFSQTFIGMSLNKVCEYSAVYRSKIRIIQRYWKGRNQAQMTMFKFFLQRQLSELLTKQMYFGLVRQQFFERNMPFNLSWQYLKQTSLKIKNIFDAYTARLHEIEQIKQMNNQIKQFNNKSLKKYHKNFLQVPILPVSPICRYFRELSILKSMLRSWFEIEYRRQVRKMKKEGKNVGQEKKSKRKQ